MIKFSSGEGEWGIPGGCKLRRQATACGLRKTQIIQCGWHGVMCGRKRAYEGENVKRAGTTPGKAM